MKKLFLGTVAVVAALVSPALAADMRAPVMKAPVMAQPVASWTGCYLGVGGGYGLFDHATRLTTTGFVNVALDQGGRGWFFTGQVGCDYQVGPNWVIGAFGDGDWSRIRGFHTGQDRAVGLISAEMEQSSSWAAGGRIGYLVTPQLLSFASGGWTEARYDQLNYLNGAGALTGLSLPATTFNGWFIGGGVEYAIGMLPGLFWKTEYRWADYSSKNVAVFATATGVPNGYLENIHPHVQTVRSELVYRFNFGGR
jgi:outer membrane immunogenic protein